MNLIRPGALLLLSTLVLHSPSVDAGRSRSKPASTPRTAAPTQRPTTTTTTTLTTAPAQSPGALIEEAQRHYDGLDYDRVPALAAQALAHADISAEQKVVAYRLQGSALAIVGDPSEAERSFLLLLSVFPDYLLPSTSPPKILSVFSKVQGEMNALRSMQVAEQRKALAASVVVDWQFPARHRGGLPLALQVPITDPRGVVTSVKLRYRRVGESDHRVLPLERAVDGRWHAVVAQEWTASETDYGIDATLTVADDVGVLAELGPATIATRAGAVHVEQPLPPWVFGSAVGLTGVVAMSAGFVTAASAWQEGEFQTKLNTATPETPASGADIVAQQRLGQGLNTTAVVMWVGAGALAATAGVVALFTEWGRPTLEEPEGPEGPEGPKEPVPVVVGATN